MTEPLSITTPGVYDLPLDEYLADPVPGGSLSHSGAKTLLNRTPAAFAYEREHGRPSKPDFDFGHAAHCAVLGTGPEIAVIPDDVLGSNGATSTKAAKEFIADARARGAVPIKSDDAERVRGMAAALREHPAASKLLDPDRGIAEQSAFWIDDEFGIWRRCRFDLLPHPRDGRMLLVDYKSTVCADPRLFPKSIANFDYHVQAVFYSDAITALHLADDVVFLLVAQEKEPPYLVSVIQMSQMALRIGRERTRKAIEIYRRCRDTNTWPGYSPDIELVELPIWAERQHEELMAS